MNGLSVWSSYYIDLSPEDMVLEYRKYGYNHCELSDEHAAALLERGDPRKTGAAFRAFAAAHGLAFTQGHLWLGCRICAPDRAEVMTTLRRWIDLFEAAGVKNAVLHCDGASFPEGTGEAEKVRKNIEVLKELAAYLEGRDVTVCLENLTGFTRTAGELLEIIRAVGSDKIGICLDTGHLHIAGGDPAAFIREAGSCLKALHIADNEGKTDQHMMPFGRGTVDFSGVIPALGEVGYTGPFNLEIPGERLCPREIRGYKLEYIKKTYDYMVRRAEI